MHHHEEKKEDIILLVTEEHWEGKARQFAWKLKQLK